MANERDRIQGILQQAADQLEGARVRVTVNADGSVDGELLATVPRGESVEAILETVETELREHRIGGAWVSTGFRFEPRPSDEGKLYDRYRGLFQVFSRYYRYGALPESVAVTEEIAEGMRRKRFNKANQAIIRIHWNKYGQRPPREGK